MKKTARADWGEPVGAERFLFFDVFCGLRDDAILGRVGDVAAIDEDESGARTRPTVGLAADFDVRLRVELLQLRQCGLDFHMLAFIANADIIFSHCRGSFLPNVIANIVHNRHANAPQSPSNRAQARGFVHGRLRV